MCMQSCVALFKVRTMMDVTTVIVTAWLVDAHFFPDPVIHMQSCRLCNLRATIDRRMLEHFWACKHVSSVQVHRDMACHARQNYLVVTQSGNIGH